MSTSDMINALNIRRNNAQSAARDRIIRLLDENSFVEIGAFVSSGVVTGYGAVEGRLVYIYSQEGPVDLQHADKVQAIYTNALKTGAPVVGILDNKGISLEQGLEIFGAYGALFSVMSNAKGVIPQISVILGGSMGLSAYISGFSDFVIMPEKGASLFLESPNTYQDGKLFIGEADGAYHGAVTGIAHIVCSDEDQCLMSVGRLLRFLPSNHLEDPAQRTTDDPNRMESALNELLDQKNFSLRQVLPLMMDYKEFMELQPQYGVSAVVGFGFLGGYTAGVVSVSGFLCPAALEKITWFVTTCNAFHIPLITLIDVEGYQNSIEADPLLLSKGVQLMHSFIRASVPKISVVVRCGIGNPYVILNSKYIGADIVYAWPSAQISVMAPDIAQKTVGIELNASVYRSAELGVLDDIIEPAATRKRVIAALEALASKRMIGCF